MSGTPPASSVDEFQVIADLFAPLSRGYPGAMALTDDVALLAADSEHETAATMDAMVAGVHFLPDDPPDLVARKLMRVNLSDLAAKGARPFAVMLAAAFPRGTDLEWMKRFAAGLAADVAEFGVSLIGGDTVSTPGPLTLTLTALGKVAKGRAVLRSGAQAGDVVWVSGSIGDGALGLRAARDGWPGLAPEQVSFLASRYRLPSPRLSLGVGLIGLAHAGMDVSDGLVQDLGHICRASGLAARIEAAKVPLSPAAAAALATDQTLLASVLAGGDDYELLFTAPAHATETVLNLGRRVGVVVTAIGSMAGGAGVRVVDADGGTLSLSHGGWRHFSATETGAGA